MPESRLEMVVRDPDQFTEKTPLVGVGFQIAQDDSLDHYYSSIRAFSCETFPRKRIGADYSVTPWNYEWYSPELMSIRFTGERVIPGTTPERVLQDHLERYRFATRLVKNIQVLDVACGTGYGSQLLAESAGWVVGLDDSTEAISFAKDNYAHLNLDFLVGDAVQVGIRSGVFDVVVSFETIEHLQSGDQFLATIRGLLVDSGLLILSTPNRIITTASESRNQVSTPYHTREFSVMELGRLLSSHGFDYKLYGQRLVPSLLARNFFRGAILSRLGQSLKSRLDFRLFYLGLGPRVLRLLPGWTCRYIVAVARKRRY